MDCRDIPIISTAPGSARNVTSLNKRYVLSFATGIRLQLHDTVTNTQIWSTGPVSPCSPPASLTLLASGNLVMTNGKGQVVWHSQSACLCQGCYSYVIQVSALASWGAAHWLLNNLLFGQSACSPLHHPILSSPTATAQDTGELQVLDSLGKVVWSTASPSPGQSTQLISNGIKDLSCLFSGPQPPATTLAGNLEPLQVLRVNTRGMPQLVRMTPSAVLWTPVGYPSLAEGSYSMCLSTAGTLYTSRAAGSGGVLWQAPAKAPASPAPFVLMISNGTVNVLDRNCRRAYTSASLGTSIKRAAKAVALQVNEPPHNGQQPRQGGTR